MGWPPFIWENANPFAYCIQHMGGGATTVLQMLLIRRKSLCNLQTYVTRGAYMVSQLVKTMSLMNVQAVIAAFSDPVLYKYP